MEVNVSKPKCKIEEGRGSYPEVHGVLGKGHVLSIILWYGSVDFSGQKSAIFLRFLKRSAAGIRVVTKSNHTLKQEEDQ